MREEIILEDADSKDKGPMVKIGIKNKIVNANEMQNAHKYAMIPKMGKIHKRQL